MAKNGLIPVVAQDVRTNNVLMLAYADREALSATKRTGLMHYFSRSRNRLWKKGETSGHVQRVVSLHYDCDRDAILARVEQEGPACHRGTYSCFAKGPFAARDVFQELWEVFTDRKRHPSPKSYVCGLLAKPDRLLKKVGEEAVEFLLACRGRKRDEIVYEAADLLFHTLLALFERRVPLDAVMKELEKRRGNPPHRQGRPAGLRKTGGRRGRTH